MPAVDVELPAEAGSAAAARSAVRALVADGRGQGAYDTQALDRVILLTSEIVTNAILHARTPLRLTARVEAGQVVVRVYDRMRQQPRRRAYASDAGTGRGMHLVEAMADRWGVEEAPGGKCVWFAVTLAADQRAATFG